MNVQKKKEAPTPKNQANGDDTRSMHSLSRGQSSAEQIDDQKSEASYAQHYKATQDTSILGLRGPSMFSRVKDVKPKEDDFFVPVP